MQKLKKTVSLIIAASFIFTNNLSGVAFGKPLVPAADTLASSSFFDGIAPKDEKRVAAAFILQVAAQRGTPLRDMQNLDRESIPEIEDTIFDGIPYFFFNEAEPINEKYAVLKCRIHGVGLTPARTYRLIVSRRLYDEGVPMIDNHIYLDGVYTEKQYMENADSVLKLLKATKEGLAIKKEQSRYEEANQRIIDRFIKGIIDTGEFAELKGRAESLGWDEKYPDRIKPKYLWAPELLDSIASRLDLFLKPLGTSAKKAFEDKNIVFVKTPHNPSSKPDLEKTYPHITINGRHIAVVSHQSRNALYFLIPEETFSEHNWNLNVQINPGAGKYSALMRDEYEFFLEPSAHEVGVAYNLPFGLLDGKLDNATDEAYRVFLGNKSTPDQNGLGSQQIVELYAKHPELYRLKKKPSNLDFITVDSETGEEITRDYAWGMAKKIKTSLLSDTTPEITVVGSIVSDFIVPLGANSPYTELDSAGLRTTKDKEPYTPDASIVDNYIRRVEAKEASLAEPGRVTYAIERRWGGPALASAIVLKQLGVNVKLIAAVGEDLAEDLFGFMIGMGMDVSGIKIVSAPTSRNLIFMNRDTEETAYNLSIKGANEYLTLADIKERGFNGSVLHLGGIALNPAIMDEVSDLIDWAKEQGIMVGWDTVVDLYGKERSRDALLAMKKIDYFTPSMAEAPKITGRDANRPTMSLDYFAGQGIPAVFLKDGSRVMRFRTTYQSVFKKATIGHLPVVKDVVLGNAVGTGDAASAFAAYAVATGLSPEEMVKGMAICGALAYEQKGARSARIGKDSADARKAFAEKDEIFEWQLVVEGFQELEDLPEKPSVDSIFEYLQSPRPQARKIAAEILKIVYPQVAENVNAFFASLPISGKKIMDEAKKLGRPVLACNADNGYLSSKHIRAMMKKALENNAYIIFEVGPGALKTYAEDKPALPEYCAREAYRLYLETGRSVVYAVHLDHNQISAKEFYNGSADDRAAALNKAIERARVAMKDGFTSFATDTSTLHNFEDVIFTADRILDFIQNEAAGYGIEVGNEGEIDDVGTKISAVDDAIKYYEETGSRIDVLAGNFGSSHGYSFDDNDRLKPYEGGHITVEDYKAGKQGFVLGRVQEIVKAFKERLGIDIGIALHGFSGTPIPLVKREFKGIGVAKVNINTDWQAAVWKALEAYYPELYKETFMLARELAAKSPKGAKLVTDDPEADYKNARNRIIFGYARNIFRDKNSHPFLARIADTLASGDKKLRVSREQSEEDYLNIKLTIDEKSPLVTSREAIDMLIGDRVAALMDGAGLRDSAKGIVVDREAECRLQNWQYMAIEGATFAHDNKTWPEAPVEEVVKRIDVSENQQVAGKKASKVILQEMIDYARAAKAKGGKSPYLLASAPSQWGMWRAFVELWNDDSQISEEEREMIREYLVFFQMDEYLGIDAQYKDKLFGERLKAEVFSKLGIPEKNIYLFNSTVGYNIAVKLRLAVTREEIERNIEEAKARDGVEGGDIDELKAKFTRITIKQRKLMGKNFPLITEANARLIADLEEQLKIVVQPHINELTAKFLDLGGRFSTVIGGIGKHPHMAFNDAPEAKFGESKPIKMVRISKTSRQQQVDEGEFDNLEDVPTHPLTFTLPAIFEALKKHVLVSGEIKAPSTRETLDLEVSENYPASGLRMPEVLEGTKIWLDRAAASKSDVAQLADRVNSAESIGEKLSRPEIRKPYTLIVDNNLHKDTGEVNSDVEGFILPDGRRIAAKNRFNIERANTSDVDNILAHITDPTTTVVQISGELSSDDVVKLKSKAPGIRMVRVDTAEFKSRSSLSDTERQLARFDMYARMLLVRAVMSKDIEEKTDLYRTLKFYVETCLNKKYETEDEQYIEAIVHGDLAFIALRNLSYRPAERWQVRPYHLIAAALISA